MSEKKVYAQIAAAQGELAAVGVAKDKKNSQQGYMFRGIDDVYAALAPVLAKNRLCFLPRVMSRTVTQHESRNGGVLFYVVVDCEYDIVSADDGSLHTVKTFGEAMDSGDKATNKAMSAAYKYAAFQTFCIPTEGVDSEDDTHEVNKKETKKALEKTPESFPDGITDSQRKLIFATARDRGLDIAQTKRMVKEVASKESTKDLTQSDLDALLSFLGDSERIADFKLRLAKEELA